MSSIARAFALFCGAIILSAGGHANAAGHANTSMPQPAGPPMAAAGKPHYCEYQHAPQGGARTLYLSNAFMTALDPGAFSNTWRQYIIATYKTGNAGAIVRCKELSGDKTAQQFALSDIATSMATAGWKIVHVEWKP